MNEKRLTALNPYTLFIDDANVADFGCLVESYTVGPAAVNSAIFQGRNRTTFRQLAYTIGRRDITVSLFYAAKTQRELAEQKSQIDARLLGTPDLHLPDGFHYFAVLKSAGDLKILGIEGNRVIGLASYKLEGIRHHAADGRDLLLHHHCGPVDAAGRSCDLPERAEGRGCDR